MYGSETQKRLFERCAVKIQPKNRCKNAEKQIFIVL